jgi:hypothetical protein
MILNALIFIVGFFVGAVTAFGLLLAYGDRVLRAILNRVLDQQTEEIAAARVELEAIRSQESHH